MTSYDGMESRALDMRLCCHAIKYVLCHDMDGRLKNPHANKLVYEGLIAQYNTTPEVDYSKD